MSLFCFIEIVAVLFIYIFQYADKEIYEGSTFVCSPQTPQAAADYNRRTEGVHISNNSFQHISLVGNHNAVNLDQT